MVKTVACVPMLMVLLVLDQQPGRATTQSRWLPFELVSNYLVAVRGGVGSLEDLTLVVDTGTARTVVDTRLAARLATARRPDVMEVFGAFTASERTVVPAVSFAGVRAEHVEVLVADLQPLEVRFGSRIDALLGVGVLSGRCLTIDYGRRRLAVDCTGPLAARASFTPPMPVIEVSIDGHAFRLVADSGSEIIAIYQSAIPPRFALTPEGSVAGAHATGGIALTRFTSRHVLAGGYSLGSPPVFVIPGEQRIAGYDGVIGTRWLTDGQVRLDFGRGTVSWSPPG